MISKFAKVTIIDLDCNFGFWHQVTSQLDQIGSTPEASASSDKLRGFNLHTVQRFSMFWIPTNAKRFVKLIKEYLLNTVMK